MALVLYDDGNHKCVAFTELVQGEGIQSNQFAIIDKGDGMLLDPGGNLTYNLGTVSSSSLGSEDQPNVSTTNVTALPTDLNLVIECATTPTSVDLKLTPTQTSGKGIAVTGGAQNVQIMLTKADNSIIDFTSGSSTLNGLVSGGNSSMNLKAYYTRKAGKAVADVTAGQANATVAYTLSYN